MDSCWKIEERDYGMVLTLLSEWDLDRVNEFSNFVAKKLEPQKNRNFVVNLANVDYIDSMALGVMINLHRRFKEGGGTVFLISPKPTVDKILRESGVYRIFQIFTSEVELKRHLAQQILAARAQAASAPAPPPAPASPPAPEASP